MEQKGLKLEQPNYIWQPTFQLRWHVKTMKIDHEQIFHTQPVLQQKYMKVFSGNVIKNSHTSENYEWREVPIVEE